MLPIRRQWTAAASALHGVRTAAASALHGVRRRCLCTCPDPDNVFLRILHRQHVADIVEDGETLLTFHDHRPASDIHLLVIPKRFVRDASTLQPADAPLVHDMRSTAVRLTRSLVDDFEPEQLALGFHWPPALSVPWLHLHAIYPITRRRWPWKWTPFGFVSPERVIDRLQRQSLVFRPPAER
jgi:diadenosine tetraphosphate (Ap4A) HIT family hydrolase